MILAERVSRLGPELRRDLGERIRTGEEPVQVVKEVLAQQTKPGKRSERLPTGIEKLEEIAELLVKVHVDTDLSAEDAKRGLDVLTRCSDRCRTLAGHLKRPAMAHKSHSANSQAALKQLNPQ